MSLFLERLWYQKHPARWALYPLSLVYKAITILRRWYLQSFAQMMCPVPLIVVGNISVGGVGKTPLVIALAQHLQQKGIKVGIVSRGYGSTKNKTVYEVQLEDNAAEVGDEPLLIALKTKCPVVIAKKRTKAVWYLLTKHQCQIILSDDGLQHYKMGRAIEIAVIDGSRGLGNGLCLPAGPLRESKKRLNQVDFLVVNSGEWDNAYPMTLIPDSIRNLKTHAPVNSEELGDDIVAMAGIGNPQRFYLTLQQLKIKFTTRTFPDHYQFTPQDFSSLDSVVIMTEKDAVKCRSLRTNKLYYLPVEATLDDAFWKALWSHQQLQGLADYDTN